MLRLTVTNKLSPALEKFRTRLQDRIVTAAGTAVQLIIARSVTDYMRDAKGEPLRRSLLDKGPLRIVTGRLVRSLTGARTGTNQPESIYRVATSSGDVNVTFGSSVPYAAIHEFGGQAGRGLAVTIPGRPYLGPTLLAEEGEVINLFDLELQRLANEVDL